jgi:membrane-bound serine protease (ClpP class)
MVELYHPGAIFPGVTGALCLLLAFYGLGTLPVNLAGVLFIVLGVALFALDVVMPTHGVLTVGGILSFLLGSAVLINAPDGAPYLTIAWQAIALVTLFFVIFFGFLLGTVVRIQRQRSLNGRQTLVGQRAQVRSPLKPSGLVFAQGELWSATTDGEAIPAGEWVEVEGVEGLRLRVRRAALLMPPAAESAEPAPGV